MNVCRESSDDITTSAAISSPEARITPVARVPSVRTRATGASVRIVTPAASAASAIAYAIAPVPPRGTPHARNAPSISPM